MTETTHPAGSSGAGAPAPARGAAPDPAGTAPLDRRALAHLVIDRCWRQQDPTALDELALPDCRYHLPGHPVLDNAGFLALMREIWQAKPDLRVEVLDMIVDDPYVATRLRFSGTQHGELLGIPPTHRRVDIEEMVLAHFDDSGRLVEFHQEADFVGMLGQLGVVPPPGTGPLGQLAHTVTTAVRFTWLGYRARRNAPRTPKEL